MVALVSAIGFVCGGPGTCGLAISRELATPSTRSIATAVVDENFMLRRLLQVLSPEYQVLSPWILARCFDRSSRLLPLLNPRPRTLNPTHRARHGKPHRAAATIPIPRTCAH